MSSLIAEARKLLNILLVEDDDGDVRAIQRAFRKAGIANHMERAVDGLEALEMMKGGINGLSFSSTILLVDLNMPRMGGIPFVQALRRDSALRHCIVFILTTSKREEDKAAAYDLNVAGYINKATAAEDFLNLIALLDYYNRIVELP